MNFEKNKKYFKVVTLKTGIVLIIIGLIMLMISNSTVRILGFLVLLGGIAYIYFQLAGRPSDEEIDQQYSSKRADILKRAFSRLGVDEDQVKEIEPIILEGMEFTSTPSRVVFKIGKDKNIRSSNYEYTVFLFSADQVYCYESQFSIIEDKNSESTEEYFYTDIVSASTVSKTEKLSTVAGSLEVNYDSFKLTTSGGTSISASIRNVSGVDRQINGMKQLLRNKKQESRK